MSWFVQHGISKHYLYHETAVTVFENTAHIKIMNKFAIENSKTKYLFDVIDVISNYKENATLTVKRKPLQHFIRKRQRLFDSGRNRSVK